VFAVAIASAVGGSVAGGRLGRRAGLAVGTRLREKLRPRVAQPERLDSVVGYAEQGGELLGSVVGGTVAGLAALSLADRFLALIDAGVLGPTAGYGMCDFKNNVCVAQKKTCCMSVNKVMGDCCSVGETCCRRGEHWAGCADLSRDSEHCGQCEISCGDWTQGHFCCGGKCVNAADDHENCGGCGRKCRYLLEDCVGGHCVPSREWRLCGGKACHKDDWCLAGKCYTPYWRWWWELLRDAL
jgi:hypothetical protein